MAEPVLLLRIIKTIVGLLGMIGNGIVCVVIYKNKFMHTLTNTFIFNQAVLDGLGSVMLILSSNIVVINPKARHIPRYSEPPGHKLEAVRVVRSMPDA